MPKSNVNYQNTIIYKLEHLVNKELVYVGSTTNFIKRKCAHKHDCINSNSKDYNFKVYQMIRENGGWDLFQMLEIKKYPCNDKREAEAEEERCRIELRANMNMRRAFCTPEQYREEQREYNKRYYANHREEYRESGKRHYANHREECREYDKQYRNENRDKLKQKFACECGGKYTHHHKAIHFKTKKHLYFIDASPPSSNPASLIF